MPAVMGGFRQNTGRLLSERRVGTGIGSSKRAWIDSWILDFQNLGRQRFLALQGQGRLVKHVGLAKGHADRNAHWSGSGH